MVTLNAAEALTGAEIGSTIWVSVTHEPGDDFGLRPPEGQYEAVVIGLKMSGLSANVRIEVTLRTKNWWTFRIMVHPGIGGSRLVAWEYTQPMVREVYGEDHFGWDGA